MKFFLKIQCIYALLDANMTCNARVWAALLLSCETGCSLYTYMLVRLSGCVNHIKGAIIIIIIIIIE